MRIVQFNQYESAQEFTNSIADNEVVIMASFKFMAVSPRIFTKQELLEQYEADPEFAEETHKAYINEAEDTQVYIIIMEKPA